MRTNSFLLLLSLWCVPVAAGAAQSPLINMQEKRSENLRPFPKWTGAVERFVDQQEIPDSKCGQVQYHPCVIKDWRELLVSLQGKPLREQLREINSWGNKHPYIIDQVNWGLEDYWETPFEFMAINGDCEDYAIAKYYSLKALGHGDDIMRIMIVQDFNLGGIIHAVLGVEDDGELFILDNQIQQVMPARKILHYRPIYGINESAWWVLTPYNG